MKNGDFSHGYVSHNQMVIPKLGLISQIYLSISTWLSCIPLYQDYIPKDYPPFMVGLLPSIS